MTLRWLNRFVFGIIMAALMMPGTTFAQESTCLDIDEIDLSPAVKNLSPLWAQKLVGIDLAHHRPMPPVSDVASLDISFAGYRKILKGHLAPDITIGPYGVYSPHGAAVLALITHPRVGASRSVRMVLLWPGVDPESFMNGLDQVEKKMVRIINVAAGINDPAAAARIDSLANRGFIFVTSAGNSAHRTPKLDPNKRNLRAIIVGSLDTTGSVSAFSQEGPNVAIYAPGHREAVLSYEQKQSPELSKGLEPDAPLKPFGFGLTSASTPLVTGTVADLSAMLPFLNVDDAKKLLRNSGITLDASGRKMLNVLRARRVAERIAQANAPHPRELLDQPFFYDFSHEARWLRGKASLPTWTCEQQRQKRDLLRTAFLLDPTPEAALELAKIYEKIWPRNAEFYRQFGDRQLP